MAASSAAPELLLDVEISGLQRALVRLSEVTGKRLGAVVKQNSRLIAWNLAHNTQPYGMDVAAKKLGENAVMRDIGRVFTTADVIFKIVEFEASRKVALKFRKALKNASKGTNEGLAKAIYKMLMGGQFYEARRILKATGVQGVDIPIGPPTDKRHNSRRNGRGRVVDKWPSQIVPTKKELTAYIKKEKALVGFGKAGWITAGTELGAVRNVPAWIKRHRGQAPGRAEDHSRRKDDPFVTLTNQVRYASKILPEHAVASALRMQTEKMLAHIEHVITNTAKECGFEARPDGPAVALPEAA